jgi:hypothetical protein
VSGAEAGSARAVGGCCHGPVAAEGRPGGPGHCAGISAHPAGDPEEAAAKGQVLYSASRMRRIASASEDGDWPINSINDSRFSITEPRSRGLAPRLIALT